MTRALRPSSSASVSELNLRIALGVSLFVHALLLSLQFKFPDAARTFQDKALDIILVNSKSPHRPTHAQALAQANLDGGGNTDAERRATTPLPPSTRQQNGSEVAQAEKRVRSLEVQQQRLLAQARSKNRTAPTEQAEPTEPIKTVSGLDLASSALAMARMEGEIAKETQEYNKRPRKRFIGTRTEEYRFTQYIENWRLKVERVGTLNYPEAARGKLYGTLVLTVMIRSDGSVDAVEINRSSGHRILDKAARRIVTMAGPYASFPPDIRRDTDVLGITRSWSFTRGDRLETQ